MPDLPKLGVVIASVREGRVGLPVANWFVEFARKQGGFDISVVDLKVIDLPILSEPKHPRFAQYQQPKTKQWSATVAVLDAFVIVTPEYNFSSPPALVNALHHLYVEWHYKPAAFVSYGGISGGTRSVEMTKQILTTLKMVPIVEAVTLPFVVQSIDVAAGVFKASAANEKAAQTMLAELARWSHALAPMRRH
ncbi:MAG TPA: NAD(P)H-dependent oxidoreductase [Vicinamibacterales bacterium]|nr:NAD(P)H-dependent oxidoreductase [Vicinamibacterales bacterium]